MACPSCKTDIDVADIRKACNLSYHDVPTDEITDYSFDCPNCGKPLSASVEPEISWYVHSVQVVPTKSDEKYVAWAQSQSKGETP